MQVALLICEDKPAYARLFRDLLARTSTGTAIELVSVPVYEGEFPRSVHDYDGYVITGSYAGVYDAYPWIPRLMQFVREAYQSAIPMVGVCFGHQVLAHALGGCAAKASDGWELGVRETRITRHYRWMDPMRFHSRRSQDSGENGEDRRVRLIYIHQDHVVDLPERAEVFAGTDLCPIAGFTLDTTVLGLQGHPEFTPAVAEEVLTSQPEKFPPDSAAAARKSLTQPDDSALAAGWIARFLVDARGPEMERLAEAIRYRTVASGVPSVRTVFDQFETFLLSAFPRLHRTCTVERPGDPGLLYTWSGSDPALDPVLFLAHYDVVASSGEGWRFPPFSGMIAEGYIWGRGTLDDKGPLMSLLEAVDRLIREGYTPRRTVLIALGGDEESSGTQGAARIAATLQRRGITTLVTFDEGSMVVEGMLPFIERPLALIGTAEKGYLDARVLASQTGGHAAMPGGPTALGRVVHAVSRITRHAFSPRMPGSTAFFLRRVGGHTRGGAGILLRHPRLFAPILIHALRRTATGDALVFTTAAPTMARGSTATSVLPARAEITLNLRLLPGTDRASALKRLRSVVRDPDVVIEELPGGSDPVPDSPVDTPVYRTLESVTAAHFPDAVVTPFLVTVTTDSRHYRIVSGAIYRFVPVALDENELAAIHGKNERIGLRDYRRSISWYYQLIKSVGELAEE